MFPLVKGLHGKLSTTAPENLYGLIGYYLKSAWEIGKVIGSAEGYREAAPQGQPVATDAELDALYTRTRDMAMEDRDLTTLDAIRRGVAAVAARVRNERL